MGFVVPIGLMMRSKNILGVNMLKLADNKPHVLQVKELFIYKIPPNLAPYFHKRKGEILLSFIDKYHGAKIPQIPFFIMWYELTT